MKRTLSILAICLAVALPSGYLLAWGHKTNVSGTWDCVAHGTANGDMKFTLVLQQSKEIVDGNIDSPLGQTEITSGAMRKKELELHFDMPQGPYTLMAHLDDDGKLVGAWSLDSEKGSWEGTERGAAANKSQ